MWAQLSVVHTNPFRAVMQRLCFDSPTLLFPLPYEGGVNAGTTTSCSALGPFGLPCDGSQGTILASSITPTPCVGAPFLWTEAWYSWDNLPYCHLGAPRARTLSNECMLHTTTRRPGLNRFRARFMATTTFIPKGSRTCLFNRSCPSRALLTPMQPSICNRYLLQ